MSIVYWLLFYKTNQDRSTINTWIKIVVDAEKREESKNLFVLC